MLSLSICVITMNRAQQVKEALESCFKCDLPNEIEFVIIDNASEDDTDQVIKALFSQNQYHYYYERLNKNLGVGGGRNYCFSKASGELIYMLDDDAVVSNDKLFFKKAISIFELNPKIVSLTTSIYDTVLKQKRKEEKMNELAAGLYQIQVFAGGSHFLRKSYFQYVQPYLPNKYGSEEIPSSLYILDDNKINAFCPSLLVEHRPKTDKWDYSKKKNHSLLITGIAQPYAIKKSIYPYIFTPMLFLAYKARMCKYAKEIRDAKRIARKVISETKNVVNGEYKKRISCKTVFGLIKKFKLSAL